MQGRLDSPLTREGMEQAHAHGRMLKALPPIEQMYVSPSGRTRETAFIINSYVRSRVSYVDALLEKDVGSWSGLTVDELEDSFPQAWRERMDDPYHHRPPAGENLADMNERASEFLATVLSSASESVALVTHQVMSRVILGHLLGLTQTETVQVIHPNEALYRLLVAADGVESCYFVEGEGPFDGLLHQGDDETILGLSRIKEDPGE
jgi:broad specificity phosphatase PhoE